MLLIVIAVLTLFRQASHTPIHYRPAPGREQIAWSILALVLTGALLCIGMVRRARNWRLASPRLMLVAVMKVFRLDAAGFDSIARIAFFAALRFSLSGIGWLFSYFLPMRRNPLSLSAR